LVKRFRAVAHPSNAPLSVDLRHRKLNSDPTTMPQPSRTSYSTTTTSVLLCLLIFLALFPGAFHYLWTLPFSLLGLTSSTPPRRPRHLQYTTMTWFQKQFTLPSKSRGSYLITDQVLSQLPEIREYKVGILNLFVQHTSCALSLNENCKLHVG
jgi:hypothetical protein